MPPGTVQSAALRGLSVTYREAGAGPPLLLVHGLFVSHAEWDDVVPLLARRFRCIAPDLPGHGESDCPSPADYPYTREAYAETLRALLEHVEAPRAHVCGHSMGGAVALTLAADHPDQVDRLVVIDSACFEFPMPLKGRLPLLPIVGAVLFKKLYLRPMFRDYFRNDVWSGHPGMDLERVDAFYRSFNRPGARDACYAALQRSIGDVGSLVPKIRRVAAPTRILWGADDRIFPASLGHRLVKEIPDATLDVIPHSGHSPNEEHPEVVAKLITDHLRPEVD
jgi:pimeloyl-ACP methyl ester carboxylesterase